MIEPVRDLAQATQIYPEWQDFIEQFPCATPFHHPAWLLPWWQHFGSGQLLLLCERNGGSLRGLLPAFIHQWEDAQQLTLLGSGISDYLEPCVKPNSLATFSRQLLDQHGWSRARWQDLPSHTPWQNPDLWPGIAISTEPETPVATIALMGDFDTYWSARGKDLRRNLRRYRLRASQQKPLRFECLNHSTPELIEALIHLHSLRWAQRGQEGTIAANGAASFLHDVAHRLSQAGLIRFFLLRWGEEIVAVSLGFEWRKRIYSYLSALSPENEGLGFGRMLIFESLRHVWTQGVSHWEFLRGEEPYKYSWGAVSEARIRLTLQR